MSKERQFLNEQLVTLKHFNAAIPAASPSTAQPSGTPPAPAEVQPAPEPARYETPSPDADAQPFAKSPPKPREPGTGIAPLLQREQASLQAGLLRKEWDEYHRRRQEVLEQLEGTLASMGQERLQQDARLQMLAEIKSEIEGQVPESGNDLSTGEFRTTRRLVENAHLELLKLEREELAPPHAGKAEPLEICSLTLLQLTRLGLGLTWPVIAAVLLGAIIIAIALLIVF